MRTMPEHQLIDCGEINAASSFSLRQRRRSAPKWKMCDSGLARVVRAEMEECEKLGQHVSYKVRASDTRIHSRAEVGILYVWRRGKYSDRVISRRNSYSHFAGS